MIACVCRNIFSTRYVGKLEPSTIFFFHRSIYCLQLQWNFDVVFFKKLNEWKKPTIQLCKSKSQYSCIIVRKYILQYKIDTKIVSQRVNIQIFSSVEMTSHQNISIKSCYLVCSQCTPWPFWKCTLCVREWFVFLCIFFLLVMLVWRPFGVSLFCFQKVCMYNIQYCNVPS